VPFYYPSFFLAYLSKKTFTKFIYYSGGVIKGNTQLFKNSFLFLSLIPLIIKSIKDNIGRYSSFSKISYVRSSYVFKLLAYFLIFENIKGPGSA